LSIINNHKVANLGHDPLQLITIEENIPFRSEILGIFGKLTESSI